MMLPTGKTDHPRDKGGEFENEEKEEVSEFHSTSSPADDDPPSDDPDRTDPKGNDPPGYDADGADADGAVTMRWMEGLPNLSLADKDPSCTPDTPQTPRTSSLLGGETNWEDDEDKRDEEIDRRAVELGRRQTPMTQAVFEKNKLQEENEKLKAEVALAKRQTQTAEAYETSVEQENRQLQERCKLEAARKEIAELKLELAQQNGTGKPEEAKEGDTKGEKKDVTKRRSNYKHDGGPTLKAPKTA
mmetsp:Transcript_35251/g.89037  ORF Transcript_35251/g.89037 Transcript_35251/m.89037 type:complete len:245 (-) Transcript_35251:238-972(-)